MPARSGLIPISKPVITPHDLSAVVDSLQTGVLSRGQEVERLEAYLASKLQVEHVVAVSSGTAALHVAVLACGIGPGDEVITTPFSFVGTVNAILLAGATPVFVDVRPDGNLDLDQAEAAITSATKAILPVHLFGNPLDGDHLRHLRDTYQLRVIEDCAQALLSRWNDTPAGTLDIGAFSFYATKNVTAGEGGAIATNDHQIAKKARMLRSQGLNEHGAPQIVGFNYRLPEFSAALAHSQLQRVDQINAGRAQNAHRYLSSEAIRTASLGRDLPSKSMHTWHLFTLLLPHSIDRDRFARFLASRGIGSGVYYRETIASLPHVRTQSKCFSDLRMAISLSERVLSIPVRESLTLSEVERIHDCVQYGLTPKGVESMCA